MASGSEKISGFKGIDIGRPSRGRDEIEARRMAGDTAHAKNPKVLEVAKQYEKQFMREMVKAMRQSVGASGYLKESMAEGIYREQLDEQYVEGWGENNSLGLSDLIYNEIMQKMMGREADGTMRMKSQGPLPLSEKDVTHIKPLRSQIEEGAPASGRKQVALEVQIADRTGRGPMPVRTPWSGTLVSLAAIDGRTSATIDHGEGLSSRLWFDGVAADKKVGEKISQGEVLGLLNPDARAYLWNLATSNSGDKNRPNVESALR